jgi:hypothetical protein
MNRPNFKRTELLANAKTYLGVKGKRRNNPETTARYLGYIPRGKNNRRLEPNSPEFRKKLDDYMISRYIPNITYAQTARAKYRWKWKSERNDPNAEWKVEERSETFEGTEADLSKNIEDFEADLLEELDHDSPKIYQRDENGLPIYEFKVGNKIPTSAKMVATKKGRQRIAPVKLGRLFMRRAFAYKLDKPFIESDDWDSKQGTCVLDWIYHHYIDTSGFTKLLKRDGKEEAYKKLSILFKQYYDRLHFECEVDEDEDELDDELLLRYCKVEDYDPIEMGICIDQLEFFCNEFGISMYAFDKEQNVIKIKKQEKRGKGMAMIFMIANSHFYPIIDEKMRKTLIGKHLANDANLNEWKEKEQDWFSKDAEMNFEKKEREHIEPIFNDTELNNNDYAMKVITETETLPSKVRVEGATIESFMIDKQKYICRQKDYLDDLVKEYCNKTGTNYWGQSVQSILKEQLDDIYTEKWIEEDDEGEEKEVTKVKDHFYDLVSKVNPFVYSELVVEGVKNRQHYGTTDDLDYLFEMMPETITEEKIEYYEEKKYKDIFTREEKKTLVKKQGVKQTKNDPERVIDYKVRNNEIVCYDIRKHYTSCIANPYDDFLVLGGEDKIEPYDGELKFGLYYVETYDLTLLHQSNWYSNKIVELAIKNNIELKITHQLLPSDTKPVNKDYFQKHIKYIQDKCNELEITDEFLFKRLMNTLIGKLGKTNKTERVIELDTNVEEVWNCFLKHDPPSDEDNSHWFYNPDLPNKYTRFNKGNRIICENLNTDEDPLYMYGFEKNQNLNDLLLPVWIQILDWSNMRVYEMMKKVGGRCLFRKTDCIVMEGGKDDCETEGWGGYKREWDMPFHQKSTLMKDDRHIKKPEWNCKWKNHHEYHDSSDADKIIELAMEKKGLMITGRAGTGKTYIIKNNKYITDENSIKMSFTNKASRNCGGSTIHKTLHLNGSLKTQEKTLNKLKGYQFCIIDEIGMIGNPLWNLLKLIKQVNRRMIFILMGDFRQLPPIDETRNTELDVFNHPIVNWLVNGNQIELTTRKRYDEPLWNYLERGYEYGDWGGLQKTTPTPKQINENRALCYYNKTRVRINAKVNKWVADKLQFGEKKFIPFTEENAKKNERGQDAFIYHECPIMCIRNVKEQGLINSDEYKVVDFDDESFTIIRTDDDEFEPKQIDLKKFQTDFVLNYISTTHKSQGATFTEKVYLYDYDRLKSDRRIIYTAVSRATSLSNVYQVN